MQPSTAIDPAVDSMARLYEHLLRTELGIQKLIIDKQTQPCRPAFQPTFEILLEVAAEHGLTPRQLIDHLIAGCRIRRRADPSFNPRTRDLVTPSYRRWILRAR